jgi:hypothetical protein
MNQIEESRKEFEEWALPRKYTMLRQQGEYESNYTQNAWIAWQAALDSDTRFTVEEIAHYISGWAMGPFDSVRAIGKATLLNALSQLRCDQDGIDAVIRRKNK